MHAGSWVLRRLQSRPRPGSLPGIGWLQRGELLPSARVLAWLLTAARRTNKTRSPSCRRATAPARSSTVLDGEVRERLEDPLAVVDRVLEIVEHLALAQDHA